ncbi:MAG: hypothetical protein KKA81_13985 [Bacteroidetes bacterium]|nr:hypothetical protein [Bacteroidota bacterium]
MYISQKNIIIAGSGLLLYLLLEVFSGMYFLSSAGLALSLVIFMKFVNDIGNKIEIRDVIALIAALQWLVGPILAYNFLPEHPLYYMSVSEEVYMNYVFTGTFIFIIGMYLPIARERTIGKEQFEVLENFVQNRKSLGYILIGIGLLFSFMSKFVPGSLAFLFYLLGNMQFVGIFIVLFADKSFSKWIVFGAVMGALILNSVAIGMFHELIIWMLFTFLIVAFIVKMGMGVKITIMVTGIVVMLLIQSIKEEYRYLTWYSTSNKSNTEIFQDILFQRLTDPRYLFQEEVLNNAGARLNQGWIISRIMDHIPRRNTFVKGETVKNAISAALLPRVLAPSKAKAGGHENFERFTGIELAKGTSMNLSIIGEAYGNFGVTGGILFMLILGLLYNGIIVLIIKLSHNNPTLILWLPLLFFQVIKAETDFAIVINHLVKSAMVIFVVFYVSKSIFKIRM